MPEIEASKLRRMKSANPALIKRGESTASSQSIETEPKPPKIYVAPPLPVLRKKSAPLWLNDYVASWIHEQRQMGTW